MLRVVLWLCVLAFAGWTTAIVGLLPIAQNEPLWSVWLSLALLLGATFAGWYSHKRVELDADGIQSMLPGMAPRRLSWTQVRRIREAADGLELQGDPDVTVRIDFLLAEIERLREIIIHHCPQAVPGRIAGDKGPEHFPVTFYVPLSGAVFLFAFGVLMLAGGAFICWQGVNLRLGLATISVSALLLVYPLFAWHSLTVDCEKLTINAALRRRDIPLDDIAAAEIEMVRPHGSDAIRVLEIAVLKLTNGKTLRLGRFREGAIHVRELVNAALRRYRDRHCR